MVQKRHERALDHSPPPLAPMDKRSWHKWATTVPAVRAVNQEAGSSSSSSATATLVVKYLKDGVVEEAMPADRDGVHLVVAADLRHVDDLFGSAPKVRASRPDFSLLDLTDLAYE